MKQDSDTVDIAAHGHIAVLYDTPEQCMQLLAEYFAEGLKKNELCVFVWSTPAEQVIEDFLSAGLDARQAVKTGSMRLFEMTPTYLPNGQFVADFMLNNVQNFIHDANELGYSGLRTAGEMTWLYDRPGDYDHAAIYESDVNGLRLHSPEFTGLCLYPTEPGSAAVLKSALKTHPSFVYEGKVRLNPYFGSSEELESVSNDFNDVKRLLETV